MGGIKKKKRRQARKRSHMGNNMRNLTIGINCQLRGGGKLLVALSYFSTSVETNASSE